MLHAKQKKKLKFTFSEARIEFWNTTKIQTVLYIKSKTFEYLAYDSFTSSKYNKNTFVKI